MRIHRTTGTGRTVMAAAVALAIPLVLNGCGGRPPADNSPPDSAPSAGDGRNSTAVSPGGNAAGGNPSAGGANPGDNGPGKAPDSPPATHELDPARHVLSPTPLRGRLGGVEVQPQAVVEGEYLIFRVTQGKLTERAVWIRLRPSLGQPLPHGKWSLGLTPPPEGFRPEVLLELPGQPLHLFPPGQYALTLELSPRQKGQIQGRLHLSLTDPAQSFVAGSFQAAAPRQPTEPPEKEDVPLVNGTVQVRNAPQPAVLLTGYAAYPTIDQFPLAAVDIELGEPVEPPRWEQRDYDRPRITSLIAGNGKDVPSRFEHSRLTPGRYIVFAQLKNGPAAWQWLDVKEQTTAHVELTIDAATTGGVEVTAPVGALGKAHLAPADPLRPMLDPTLALGLALQLGWEQDIVQRKALFKNLAPGTYEVWIGGEVRRVDVVAGKTAEVDFEKR